MSRHRTFLIVVLAWALAMIGPDLARLVQPLGSLGLYANSDGLVYDVAGPFPDVTASPAWQAGIRVGDRLDLSRMTCVPYDAERCASVLAMLGGLQYVLPERAATLSLSATAGRDARQVTVVAAERPTNWLVRTVLLLDSVAGILVVLGAAWLVWKRPGPMSWGFFLYAVWFNPGQAFVFYAVLQQWPLLLIAQTVLACVAQAAGYAGLLLFALRVPNDTIDARWRPLERALPLLAIVFALGLLGSYGNAFGHATETLSRAVLLAGFAVDLGALGILFARRGGQSPEDYQRMRWVIWGCAIGLPTFILAQLAQGTSLFGGLWGSNPPYDLLGLLFLANGIFCLFVVHALSRSRVVSVSIPLRRVTILGFTLSIPALVLHNEVELIHEHLHLPDWAWLGVALVFLYLISRLHEFAVEVADRYFNRSLDRSETDLCREILAARQAGEIDRLLAAGPFRHLGLASAAAFRRTEAVFRLGAGAHGWDDCVTRVLRPGNPLLRTLSQGKPFDVDDAGDDPELPAGLRRPILAVPVANRVSCFAIALYGPHATGTDLDDNERRMLARVGDHAADCYAQLENEELRRRVALLEGERSVELARPGRETG